MVSLACESSDLALEWRRRLLWALEKKPFEGEREPDQRKVLVLVNPFGGAGAAAQAWIDAKPVLDRAHLTLTVKETERTMHGYEIA
jgi:sphingosine kinase